MWNIFKYKGNHQVGSRESQDEDAEKRYRELKLAFQQNLKQLTKNIAASQHFFMNQYLVNAKQQTLSRTFEQMMATLQGLIATILDLKKEYDQREQQIKQYKQIKPMISNHHSIIDSIQQSHSNQVAQIYEEKKKSQELLRESIRELSQHKANLSEKISKLQAQILETKSENLVLQQQNNQLRDQNKNLLGKLNSLQLKLEALTSQGKKKNQTKKTVNLQHIKLEYLFYYSKLRDQVISFLQVKDLFALQRTNKFFRASLRKEESKHIYHSLKRRYKKLVDNEIKTAQFYEKIYQSFPIENIKICAFKYLYFKIKPAAYILPFLQEEALFQQNKLQSQPKSMKEQGNKFNWKNFFTSDKTGKAEKKQQNKFSLSQFKNEEEYKKVQTRIEALFKNIFPIKMPEDFKYFSQTMERQLRELKQVIGQYKNSKGVFEWTAQLHCLSKYMYMQINELYNLLQVVFGDLVIKSKDLIATRESYDYLRQNEIVLRNLIENVSNDKSNIERKYVVMENEILKKKLESEAIYNKYQQLQQQYLQYKAKHQEIQMQHADTVKMLHKYQEERRNTEHNMSKIREEIDLLQRNPAKMRKQSVGSGNSEENGFYSQSNRV